MFIAASLVPWSTIAMVKESNAQEKQGTGGLALSGGFCNLKNWLALPAARECFS